MYCNTFVCVCKKYRYFPSLLFLLLETKMNLKIVDFIKFFFIITMKKTSPGVHNILIKHRPQVFSQMPCVQGNGLPSCSHVHPWTHTDGRAGSSKEEVCRHKARSLCSKELSNTYFLFHVSAPDSTKWQNYAKMLSCDDPLWWMRYDWTTISHHIYYEGVV